jgi:hypothetical protein
VYRVETDEQAQHQIEALSAAALAAYAELRTLLEIGPWSGGPVADNNPDGAGRTLTFGRQHQGMVTYLVLEEQRRVDVLDVLWLTRRG